MSHPHADRNLLFGIFALQMDFISRDALIKAINAWVLAKTKPLGQIMAEQGTLQPDIRQFVEAMIDKHLDMHDNDPHKSLAAVSALGSVRKDLEKIADADLENSLAQVSIQPQENGVPPTISYSAGISTSVGTSTSAGTRFRIVRPHAKGGLGQVYLAQDEELNREVALKEIQERHADNPESRARFLLEAEITGGLEHPGIVPVYGLGANADGRPFYAMRFVRGDSLKDVIAQFHQPKPLGESASAGGESLQFRNLLRRFLDICNAIQYAHARGVLHRDLKPSNIMLGKYGETLVVDWGLAKALAGEPGASAPGEEPPLQPRSAGGSAETLLGRALGTPQYMSPEQAEGRLDLLGPTSDVYSLGATLYCLLTGQVPFQDADRGRVSEKVQKGDFPRPRQVKPDLSPALEAVCLKAMARRPKDRYDSPRALADDIEHWLADEPVSAWPEPVSVKAGRWVRRHKARVSGAAAAIFVGLIALATGLLWYQDEQNRRATEQTLRQAEAARQKALAEEGVRNALGKVEQVRTALHKTLKKTGGVFELLNHPENWEAQIKIAETALKSTTDRLADASQGVDPELDKKAHALETLLAQDDKDRLVAVRVEKIRMDMATIVDGKFDLETAAREYPKAFAEAGFALWKDQPSASAGRIGASPIKDQLVAALDDWAMVAFVLNDKGLPEQLLEIGRLAAPDAAWGDRLRQIEVWQDPKILAKLADKAPLAGVSPQLLYVIVNLFGENYPLSLDESWLRQAQAQYPADFWLNSVLGYALANSRPVEAVGFLRAAVAVRPGSSVA